MTSHANGFDWDKGNRAKCEKHGLSVSAIERLFTRPLAILPDAAHSRSERRFRAIGRTEKGRGVFIVFTLRRKRRRAANPAYQCPLHAQERDRRV